MAGRTATVVAMLLGTLPCALGGAVYPLETGYLASGDFDGDGRLDVVVVDRASGAYRVGYQQSAGSLTWGIGRASGVTQISGLTVGRLLDIGRDSLAATSPALNRIHVLDDASPFSTSPPQAVFSTGIAPHHLLALDIGGPGATPHDDLLAASQWTIQSNALESIRNTGSTQDWLWSGRVPGVVADMQRVTLEPMLPEIALLLERTPGASLLEGYSLVSPDASLVIRQPNLPASAKVVWGQFLPGELPQCLVYEPGAAEIAVHQVGFDGFQYAFASVVTATVPATVRGVVGVPEEGRVIVLCDDGSARVYAVSGALNLLAVQTLLAPSGAGALTGAIPISSGDLAVLTGPDHHQSASGHQVLRWNGSAYRVAETGAIPALGPHPGQANLLLFIHEPFLTNQPVNVAALRAGDWTTSWGVNGSPAQIYAFGESDGGPTAGLGNPSSWHLGPLPPGANYVLANQYRPSIAISAQQPAVGHIPAEVTISPASGIYPTAVSVSISAHPASYAIYYRTDPNAWWQPVLGPIDIFQETTLEAFCLDPAGDTRSAIQTVTYSFKQGPDALDSDADGVPDYVELGHGLDPVASGLDQDQDGLSDLEELLEGTDPTLADTDGDTYSDYEELRAHTDPRSAASHPASAAEIPPVLARAEHGHVFDLVISPRPYDAYHDTWTQTQPGTVHYAYTLPGSLLTQATAANLAAPPIPDPAVVLPTLSADSPAGFVTVATEEQYLIQTAAADQNLGRELVGLVPCPQVGTPEILYTYAGGDLQTEAANWVAVAREIYAAADRPTVVRELTIHDTLIALLMERMVGDILVDRGLVSTSTISLLSFRPHDLGLPAPTAADLGAIAHATADGKPGYRLDAMHAALTQYVSLDATPEADALRGLVTELYRVSALSNAPPAKTLDLPVDALRYFLAEGNLPTTTHQQVTLTAPQILLASQGASDALGAVPARPHGWFNLEVRETSFDTPCTVLYDTASGQAYSLFTALGRPFLFPEALKLPPGAVVYAALYTDGPQPACTGISAEVEQILLVSFPQPSATDQDGNLLPDDWERLVFGATGTDPEADADGDGYSNLQECLEGTEARAATSAPATAPAQLGPPEVALSPTAPGAFSVFWPWPAAYHDDFQFTVQAAESLAGEFTASPLQPTADGDTLRVQFPVSPTSSHTFYRLGISLRP